MKLILEISAGNARDQAKSHNSAEKVRSAGILYKMAGKRRIFISYQREDDREFFEEFSRVFSNIYEVVRDDSPDRVNRGETPEAVTLRVRGDYISGACCTVVLCGPRTPTDSYVDWEIMATLAERKPLIGVNLPVSRSDSQGRVQVPERLHENIASGYAMWLEWTKLMAAPLAMGAYIQIADSNSKKPGLNRENDALPLPLV